MANVTISSLLHDIALTTFDPNFYVEIFSMYVGHVLSGHDNVVMLMNMVTQLMPEHITLAILLS